MNAWRDNFIGNMYGPTFLAFYFAVIMVTLILLRCRVRSLDRTQEGRFDDLPEPLDPTDIALLRGDVNEVLRLVIAELTQRGYLQVEVNKSRGGSITKHKISWAARPPDTRHLTQLQWRVFNTLKSPKQASELFSDQSLVEWVRTHCLKGEERLKRCGMITPPEVLLKAWYAGAIGAIFIAALGGYKLLAALSNGRTNVTLLIVMGLFGVIMAIIAGSPYRISRRGKAYLENLQSRHSSLRKRLAGASQVVDDDSFAFAVALFGLSVLENTPYQSLQSVFMNQASSSGCGGSCGGGCGGGCGGCGGCGD